MKRHAPPNRPRRDPDHEGAAPAGPAGYSWITTIALFIGVALVLARGMILETVRDPFQVEMGAQPIPRGPGAATGLVLDLLCALPALLVLLRAAVDRTFVIRRSLSNAFMFILGAWTILSTLWASDTFLAVISSAHWLGALVLLWSMSQLVRDWGGLRVIAASAFGLMLVLTAHGIIYRLVELPELQQQVERDWPRILQERGWEPDSYIATRFKQRVMAGEMIGFNASPNTFGAMIVMLGIVTAGLALQRVALRDEFGWPLVLVLGMVPAAWVLLFTNSRTALATPVLGAVILSAAWFGRDLIPRFRKTVFISAVAMLFLIAAVVVGHGMRHGTLFHDSLTFRWKYWIGAWRIFIANALTGVGFANFGPHYLGTRLPEAAEEINDPHNFIVRLFVELGVIGGIALLAWMTRLWWELTHPTTPPGNEPRRPPWTRDGRGESLIRLLALGATAALVSVLAAVDFAQQWEYGFIETMKRSLYMLLLMIGLVIGTFRSTQVQEIDHRPAPLLLYAMLVAIGIFLVHNLVDFSLFETGPMFVFALIVGGVLGVRLHDARALPRSMVLAALCAGSVAWLAGWVIVAGPVILAEQHAQRGDDALRGRAPGLAARHLRQAHETLWFPNADYAFRAARARILAAEPPADVHAMLAEAIAANPMSPAYPRLRAEYELRQPSPDPQRVLADYQRVIELDPNDISAHLDHARALERFGRIEAARQGYEQALRLNDLLDPAEPERLPQTTIDQIRSKIQSLRQGG